MRVTVYTRGLKGEVLTKAIDSKPIYATSIFNNQLVYVNQQINSIIHANAAQNIRITGLKPRERKTNA